MLKKLVFKLLIGLAFYSNFHAVTLVQLMDDLKEFVRTNYQQELVLNQEYLLPIVSLADSLPSCPEVDPNKELTFLVGTKRIFGPSRDDQGPGLYPNGIYNFRVDPFESWLSNRDYCVYLALPVQIAIYICLSLDFVIELDANLQEPIGGVLYQSIEEKIDQKDKSMFIQACNACDGLKDLRTRRLERISKES